MGGEVLLNRIGLLIGLLILLLVNTCLAYSYEGVSLGQDKESVINIMLKNSYSLVSQVESKGNLNYLFKRGNNSILVEFHDSYVLSIFKTYPGDLSNFIKRTENLQTELGENNIVTLINNGELKTYGIINEPETKQILTIVIGKKDNSIAEVLTYDK